MSNRVAGDKILGLQIDAAHLSPKDFEALLKSVAAVPVRLDVKRSGDASASLSVPVPSGSASVDVEPPTVSLPESAEFGVGVEADPADGDLHVQPASLDIDVDAEHPSLKLDADGEVPSAKVHLPAGVDFGGSAQVDGGELPTIGMGGDRLTAELDKMFNVDREDLNVDFGDKPSLSLDGPQISADVGDEIGLELPSARADVDVNLDPSALFNADADADVTIPAKSRKVHAKPASFDADVAPLDVEIGVAHLKEDLKVGGDMDVNDVNIPRFDKVGEVGVRATVPDVVGEGVVCAEVTGPPTVNAAVAVTTPDVEDQEPPSSTGYIKVVTPASANASLDAGVSAKIDDDEGKKGKRKSFGAKFKNLFKTDQAGKDVEVTGKIEKSVELSSPESEINIESPDAVVETNVDVAFNEPYKELTKPYVDLTGGRIPAGQKPSTSSDLNHDLEVSLPAGQVFASADVSNTDVRLDSTAEKRVSSPTGYVKCVSPITAGSPNNVSPGVAVPGIDIVPIVERAGGGFGVDLSAGDMPAASLDFPESRVSVEKSQEAFRTEIPSATGKAGKRTSADVDVQVVPAAQLDVQPVRLSVEKCEEKEKSPIGVEGTASMSVQGPSVDVKPVSPDVHVEGKKKSGRGLFGIFGQKEKKKSKDQKKAGVEMKLDVEADDKKIELDSPEIGADLHADFPLSPPVAGEQLVMEHNILPDVEVKHHEKANKGLVVVTAEPTVDLNLSPPDQGQVDIEVPEVQAKSHAVVHAEPPELSSDHGAIGLNLDLGDAAKHEPDAAAGIELKPWDVDVNANNILAAKDARLQGPDVSGELALDAASPHMEIGKADSSIELPTAHVAVDAPSGKVANAVDPSEAKLDVNLPSGTVGVDHPHLSTDADTDISLKPAEHRVHFSNQDTHIDPPHATAAVHIDVTVPEKKKSKMWNPFKSKKKGNVNAKVEAPKANIEISGPISTVEAGVEHDLHAPETSVNVEPVNLEKNASLSVDIDPQLAGSFAATEPDATTTLDADASINLDGPKVDAELPEVRLGLPDTNAEASVDAGIEATMDPAKVEHQLPGVELTSPQMQLAASSPAVDVSPPESPSISANADIPKFIADVDANISAKDGKKKSKFRLPFGSKKKPAVDVKADAPKANVEISNPILIADPVEVDIDPQLAGNLSIPKPDAELKVGAELPGVGLKSTVPDTKVPASVDANLPVDPSISVNAGKPAADIDVSGSSFVPSVDTSIEATVDPGKVEHKFPDVELTSPSVELAASSPEVEMSSPESPTIGASVEVPQLSGAADVDANISAKDGKKKSKTWNPFKSKKKVNADAKFEAPKANVEISNPVLTDADISVNVDSPAGNSSLVKPVATATVDGDAAINLDGDKVGVDIPEVSSTAPEMKAGLSADASVPDVSGDLGVGGGLPAVDTRLTTTDDGKTTELAGISVAVETPDAAVKIPQSSVELPLQKVPDADLTVQPPELKASVDVDTPETAKVTADIPQVDGKGKKKEKSSLFGKMFGGKSKEPTRAKVNAKQPKVEVDVPDVKNANIAADVDQPTGNLSVAEPVGTDTGTVEVSLPDVKLAGPGLQLNASSPEVEVESPGSDDTEVAPGVDGEVSVPGLIESGVAPDVRLHGDVGALPDAEIEADDDDVVVVKSSAPRLRSAAPLSADAELEFDVPRPTADAELAGEAWLESAPEVQSERRVERTDSFQGHGYAILVTSAMLKLGDTIHDDFQIGVSQSQDDDAEDGEDDAKSSSSSSSSSRSRRSSSGSERQSGKHYRGANNFNAESTVSATPGDGQVVNGGKDSGDHGRLADVDDGRIEERSKRVPPPVDGSGNQRTLTNGTRDDASEDIVVRRSSTQDSSVAPDA